MEVREKIFLMRPNVGDEELQLIKEVIDSGQLVEGKMVREFEKTVCEFTGAKNAIAVTSATTGLELVLRAMNVGPGDEVIVPDFTHPATALVVQTVGAEPVIVDVDLRTYNSTIKEIKEAVTEKTKVIMPVSIFGNPVEIDEIISFARERNISVIDDAACTLGSEYKGKKVGAIADATVFSFHPRKVFTTGDGGLITTDCDELAEIMVSMKKFGAGKLNGEATFMRWGTNYRMSDILGAVALGQARRIKDIVSARQEKAAVYDKLLERAEGIVKPYIEPHSMSNYQTYAVYLTKADRDNVLGQMKNRNIEVQIGTYSIHVLPQFNNCRRSGDLSNSIKLWKNLLSLPLHSQLTESDQEYIVENLLDIIKNS